MTARLQLARTYRAMGREEDARRASREALQLEPRSRLEQIDQERAREYLAGAG